MSTAAHEPRRAGLRRVESPAGSKMTPRRNASEASESNGARYDSEELPVLIRLPNLRTLGPAESRADSPSQKKQHRVDSSSASNQKPSTRESLKTNKKSFHQQAAGNKLVIGGVVGGILIVVLLFAFNASRSTPPVDEDSWANQGAELLVELPEPAPPAANKPAPLQPPGFTYKAPGTELAPFESGDLEQDSFTLPPTLPPGNMPPLLNQPETAALPNKVSPVTGWPTDEAMGSQTSSQSKPVDLWPGENISQEPDGYGYPPTDSPSQSDYQSGMYPSDAGTYRMGKLDSDRPLATHSDQSNILTGNIAIPDTKSVR